MVFDYKDVKEAAQIAGMKVASLKQALHRPFVDQFRRSLRRLRIDAEVEKSIDVLCELRDRANSEHVRREAALDLLTLAGVTAPAEGQDLEIKAPGYVIKLRHHQPPVPLISDQQDDDGCDEEERTISTDYVELGQGE